MSETGGVRTTPEHEEHDDLGQTLKVAEDHRRSTRRGRTRRWLLQAGMLVAMVALWWLVTALGWVPPLYLPSPGAVWEAFVRANSCAPLAEGSDRIICGEQGYYLWGHLLASLQRIGIGVGVAIVLGPIVGYLLATIEWMSVPV